MLEAPKLCLANATALACEILKGLVLPGIAGFTIADGKVLAETDLAIR